MKKEDYEKKKQKLIEDLEVDTSVPHYVSVKDKKVYYKPSNSKTSNEQFTEDLKNTLKDWKKKGYEKYKGKIQDIPTKIYLRFIKNDKRVLNGGVVVKNNVDEKYLYLVGKNYSRFPVQYDDIKDIYYNPKQFKKQKEKQREAERKKEQKEKEKEKKQKQKLEKSNEKKEEQKPKKDKITDEEINKLLNELYYEKGNTFGRDKLYSIAKKEDDRITRKKVEDWLKNQELYQLTKKSNKNKDFQVLKINDSVRIALKKDENKIKKSNINWSEEIYKIFKIYRPRKNKLNPIRYKVENSKGEVLKGVYTRGMLQKIENVENEDKTAVKYEVEKFVGSRLDKNKNVEYKVRWKGYKKSDDTWEKAKDLQEDLGKENYKKLVEELKEKLKKKKKK